jgi:hypothetical protein
MEYWARLATVIDNNPVQEHDRFFMAMLKPLGIEKGQPFKPDARQQAILEDGALLGDAMARNVMYEGSQRETGVTAFPGTQWDWVFYVKPRQETEFYSQLDERLQYTYGAIYLSPALGVMRAGPGGTTSRRSGTRTATTSTAASPIACTCPRTRRRRPSGP